MLWQVDKAWERPKRRFVEARATDPSASAEERRGTEFMIARLNRIIIPRVEFRDATVRQAVTSCSSAAAIWTRPNPTRSAGG